MEPFPSREPAAPRITGPGIQTAKPDPDLDRESAERDQGCELTSGMRTIGRYEIVEQLGRGAMGVVYKATDPVLGRLVAIKVLSMEPALVPGRPGERDIFIREARAAGRLSHPG